MSFLARHNTSLTPAFCLWCGSAHTRPGRITCSDRCGDKLAEQLRASELAPKMAAQRAANDAAWAAAGGSWD